MVLIVNNCPLSSPSSGENAASTVASVVLKQELLTQRWKNVVTVCCCIKIKGPEAGKENGTQKCVWTLAA